MPADVPDLTTDPSGAARGRCLVGRAEELAVLDRHLAAAAGGAPQLVLVEAPAGFGKTALVREALRDRRDVRVVWASGDELELDLPFGVLAQVFRAAGAPGVAPSSDPLSAGAALLEVHDRIADGSTVVVVVDDAGWADALSLQALSFALRRLDAVPVLGILMVRPEALPRLPDGLLRFADSGRGARLRLAGLDGEGVRALARGMGITIGQAAAQRVVEASAGSPLHATALLEDVPLEQLVGRVDVPLPAPRSFQALVAAKLAGRPEPAQRLVVAAAVLGHQPLVATAARLAGVDAPLSLLDGVVEAGLVEVVDTTGGRRIRFSHPLVASAVYHDVSPGRRAALHREAAGLGGDHRSVLRHRVAGAETADDELVSDLEGFAAAELARATSGAASAAWAFGAAAGLTTSADRRRDLVVRSFECALLAGDTGAAAVLAASLDDGSPHSRYLDATVALTRGELASAERELRAAWSLLDRAAVDHVPAAVASRLAILCLNSGRPEECVAWSRRAMADAGGRPVLGSSPRIMLALGLAALGEHGAALEAVALDGDRPVAVDRDVLERMAGRGAVRLAVEEVSGAVADLEVAVAEARRLGSVVDGLGARIYLAEAMFHIGRWDDALLHAELAASTAADADQYRMLAMPHGVAALPCVARGDWERAGRHVAAALTAAGQRGDAASVVWARTAEASLALATGDHGRVLAAVEACLAHPGVVAIQRLGMKPWRLLGAHAHVAAGDAAAAEALLAGLGEERWPAGLHGARAALARARAAIAEARGDDLEAAAWYERGLPDAEAAASPQLRAELLLAHGSFLRRRGHRRQAQPLLERAHRTFVELGARPAAERADRELRGLGLTPMQSHRAALTLTGQEQAVAMLVARGRRNREVAAELFVSVKTVEYHLGNIYRKAGVSSRTQLAAVLAGSPGDPHGADQGTD